LSLQHCTLLRDTGGVGSQFGVLAIIRPPHASASKITNYKDRKLMKKGFCIFFNFSILIFKKLTDSIVYNFEPTKTEKFG
jgi:hypothetical protein